MHIGAYQCILMHIDAIYLTNYVLLLHRNAEQDDEKQGETGDNSDDEAADDDTMSRRDVTATLSQYHTILEKIIDKQRDCKSKQKRLHRQMKRIHKEYKTIKGNQRVNS